MEPQSFFNAFSSFDQAKESITISDATKPELPLIYVNKGFETISGYKREEIVGQNCRFLQGHMRDQEGVRAIREAIAKKTHCLVELINFRKDGKRFDNRLSLRPIFNKVGKLKYFIGLQHDLTILKDLEDKIAQFVAKQAD
jgi:PAS domain S-box-containing protein